MDDLGIHKPKHIILDKYPVKMYVWQYSHSLAYGTEIGVDSSSAILAEYSFNLNEDLSCMSY